ncbi:RNA polymerase sigma-70 factor (ECF subfamily) [Leeuwenhoekiella aestuarii]|nr:RNA polymerase sigma-70 factor (ECF subfamily) [Leeuwenhoekiella aestuarii]
MIFNTYDTLIKGSLNFNMNRKEDFTKAILAHRGLLFKVSLMYTENPQDREDLYQEIVYQLWKSYDSFNALSKLSTWMYRVALNTAIYQLKKSKRTLATTAIDPQMYHIAEHRDQADEENLKRIYTQIQKLNLLEKGLILLYLEGKSHEEISEIIGISKSNVGTRISRIKEKLKTQLTN